MDEFELRCQRFEELLRAFLASSTPGRDEFALLRQGREELRGAYEESIEVLLDVHMDYWSARFDHPDEPESEGGVGDREPLRPKPSGLADAMALPIPDSDEAA